MVLGGFGVGTTASLSIALLPRGIVPNNLSSAVLPDF